jgi:Acetyltransferase (GNAT) domain
LSNKANYIAYCKQNNVPLFVQPFWFDAINNNWDVWHFKTPNGYNYFLPYVTEKKIIFKLLRNPLFTPYSGIVYDKDTYLDEAILFFINKINKFDFFELDFALDFSSIHLFESNKFKCVPQPTNILNLQQPVAQINSNFKSALKRQIKKSALNLIISNCTDVNIIYYLLNESYKKQQLSLPYTKQLLQQILLACTNNNCGQVWQANNANGEAVAVLWQVWDTHNSYYLTGGSNGQYSEAMSGLMWHAIQHAHHLGLTNFDFEGSSIPSINKFFSNFAPQLNYYYRISKTKAPILKLAKKLHLM